MHFKKKFRVSELINNQSMNNTWPPLSAYCLSILFFIKSILLGYWILPLWIVPDEVGHFSYAQDIISGQGILPLGKAFISEEIRTIQLHTQSPSTPNWIVQHPPLYHVVAGSAWKVATLITNDPTWLYRSPRIIAAFFGSLTLLYIFKIVRAFGFNKNISLSVMAGFSAIPMFTWMSSGINHDTMVAFLGTVSTYYFIDHFRGKQISSAYKSILFMSLASITKMTALVALAPLTGFLVFSYGQYDVRWVKRAISYLITALFLPTLWLIRNFIVYGKPFVTAYDIEVFDHFLSLKNTPLEMSFLKFLNEFSVIEAFFSSFIFRIRHLKGDPRILFMDYPYFFVYELVIFCVILISFSWVISFIWSQSKKEEKWVSINWHITKIVSHKILNKKLLCILLGIVVLTVTPPLLGNLGNSLVPLFSFFVLILTWSLSAIILAKRMSVPLYHPIFYAQLIFAFFAVVLLFELYNISLMDGKLTGANGRYFYPVLGMILVGIIIPALLRLKNFAQRISFMAGISLFITEILFWLIRVIPYIYKSEIQSIRLSSIIG